jgi:hypothetical protein
MGSCCSTPNSAVHPVEMPAVLDLPDWLALAQERKVTVADVSAWPPDHAEEFVLLSRARILRHCRRFTPHVVIRARDFFRALRVPYTHVDHLRGQALFTDRWRDFEFPLWYDEQWCPVTQGYLEDAHGRTHHWTHLTEDVPVGMASGFIMRAAELDAMPDVFWSPTTWL